LRSGPFPFPGPGSLAAAPVRPGPLPYGSNWSQCRLPQPSSSRFVLLIDCLVSSYFQLNRPPTFTQGRIQSDWENTSERALFSSIAKRVESLKVVRLEGFHAPRVKRA